MSDELSREISTASKLGQIDERTLNIQASVKGVENKLDEMSKAFVTKVEFRVWRVAVLGLFGAIFIAFVTALFSGNIHFGP